MRSGVQEHPTKRLKTITYVLAVLVALLMLLEVVDVWESAKADAHRLSQMPRDEAFAIVRNRVAIESRRIGIIGSEAWMDYQANLVLDGVATNLNEFDNWYLEHGAPFRDKPSTRTAGKIVCGLAVIGLIRLELVSARRLDREAQRPTL